MEVNIIDTGLKKYAEVLQQQEQLFQKNISAKLRLAPTCNYLILCEHHPVFTLGKNGKKENVIVSEENLNAEFFHTNRGGDVTFHCPGQLVVYPVLDLDTLHVGLAEYILKLEETIMESLKNYGLKGERIKNANGVWLKDENDERKICAIGVKASRHITMHGLAMNINTDLSYFNKIIPCGLENKEVTSLQMEMGREIKMEDYKKVFLMAFQKIFGLVTLQTDTLTVYL